MAVLVLPFLDALAHDLVQPDDGPAIDFSRPAGEPALTAADSVSWRVFKNPVALFVGGVAAVILELADPAVRSGVWEHSSFRRDAVARLRRTGLAAMVTVYGPRRTAEAMIAQVGRLHARVRGRTPAGEIYEANDPALLRWVHATAAFGFAEAYDRYVRPLGERGFDRLYGEGAASACLYGAIDAPLSRAAVMDLIDSKRDRLQASPIPFEFLDIMRRAPVLPAPLRPLQRLLIRAAVDLVPAWIRQRLGLDDSAGLHRWQRPVVRLIGRLADRVLLRSSPAVQSCLRLGLPADYLYR
ncbi:Uncharacterized conserved protein, DUF2236 family [Enhydrobacter aerosaccus]|uniref:Uncharacterized conserved protein, DUF2236 family n=1 Tax=Enhydrobacter aerosaccus TaxID=225324 RepID=A0A1T4LTE9_9HYPH|nr:oxygenase MpaB family protein [Enhydrobacter aerosaccus]SJZ57901.1 Uncharacterized conserved protein, DUF2236 family [Enhydrobacter aerosaccus]